MPAYKEMWWFSAQANVPAKHAEAPARDPMAIPDISKLISTMLPYPVGGLAESTYLDPYDTPDKATRKGRMFLSGDQHRPDLIERHGVDEARRKAAALVAAQIVATCDSITSAIPCRFNQPGCLTSLAGYDTHPGRELLSEHIAIFLQYRDVFTTLLLLSIDVIGRRTRPFVAQRETGSYCQYQTWSMSTDKSLRELVKELPLLMVYDQVLLRPCSVGAPSTLQERERTQLTASRGGPTSSKITAPMLHALSQRHGDYASASETSRMQLQ
ncbi:hypothetical protein E8E13_001078 [Curvularia kusanoi]|uniref:Uncharacterized protein n=1 Tax=Curvularia kusanoi TaxID=90978 RepID=A0A9P4WDX7_CURKU|nr:hypothetical protein E8E13_001078 [Curvularia kusanoi]